MGVTGGSSRFETRKWCIIIKSSKRSNPKLRCSHLILISEANLEIVVEIRKRGSPPVVEKRNRILWGSLTEQARDSKSHNSRCHAIAQLYGSVPKIASRRVWAAASACLLYEFHVQRSRDSPNPCFGNPPAPGALQ